MRRRRRSPATRSDLLNRLFDAWAVRLRLEHWTIAFTTNAQEDDFTQPNGAGQEVTGGRTYVYHGSQRGWIKIGPSVMECDDPHNARHVLVHELMHLRWWRATEAVDALHATDVFTGSQWDIFNALWTPTIEVCIDETTRAMLAASGWYEEDAWFFKAWESAPAH